MAKKSAKKSSRKSAGRKKSSTRGAKKNVALLIADVFEDMEALYPYYRLQEAGYKVTVIGAKKGETYTSKHGYPMKSDMASNTAKASQFAGVIVPGGYAPDKMRRDAKMVKLVKHLDKAGKLVASICHGPWVFCEADILRGRDFTSVGAIKTDCVNAGGRFHNKSVVRDKNLVTSRTPPDLPDFMKTVLDVLEGK